MKNLMILLTILGASAARAETYIACVAPDLAPESESYSRNHIGPFKIEIRFNDRETTSLALHGSYGQNGNENQPADFVLPKPSHEFGYDLTGQSITNYHGELPGGNLGVYLAIPALLFDANEGFIRVSNNSKSYWKGKLSCQYAN